MDVPFYKQRTVTKGKGIGSIKGVQARLREIYKNPKSTYHTALLEGRLHVHEIKNSRYPRWDIIEVTPVTNVPGTATCGECTKPFFSFDDDYLCSNCRE
jgi:hypothetical protein